MIKAIIFDFGNVICKFDNNIFLERISRYTERSPSELKGLIYQEPGLLGQYETGLISSDEFFGKTVRLCNLKIPKSEFIRAFTEIFTPIKTTFDLIRRLKPDYKLALLSDTSEWDFDYGIRPTEVFRLFDTVSLSFEVKEKKPGKKIFFDAIDKLGLKPEECIYIDDIEEYVDAANQLGIHAIKYTTHERLVGELRKLNIRV